MLRNHSADVSFGHKDIGLNSRLDDLQAAILLIKLKRISDYNARRRVKAAIYTESMTGKIKCPVEREGAYHVYHQYTIRTPRRDKIKERLLEQEVSSNVYYPIPLHLQPALSGLAYKKGDFPEAERASAEVLSLPICPEIEDGTVRRIAEIVLSV